MKAISSTKKNCCVFQPSQIIDWFVKSHSKAHFFIQFYLMFLKRMNQNALIIAAIFIVNLIVGRNDENQLISSCVLRLFCQRKKFCKKNVIRASAPVGSHFFYDCRWNVNEEEAAAAATAATAVKLQNWWLLMIKEEEEETEEELSTSNERCMHGVRIVYTFTFT